MELDTQDNGREEKGKDLNARSKLMRKKQKSSTSEKEIMNQLYSNDIEYSNLSSLIKTESSFTILCQCLHIA